MRVNTAGVGEQGFVYRLILQFKLRYKLVISQ